MADNSEELEFTQNAIRQVFDIFITPEVIRRQNNGVLSKPLPLANIHAVQIVFFPDKKPNTVRINEEVRANGVVDLKPEVAKRKNIGDPVYSTDIVTLKRITLSENSEKDCGHITLIRFGNQWVMGWDAICNKDLAKQHLDTASDFFAAAEFLRTGQKWRPFVDTLFSASELAAKSILLTFGGPELREKGSHKAISSRYNLLFKHLRGDNNHVKVFNRLCQERYPARYLEGACVLTPQDAESLSETVKGMLEDARHRLGNEA